MQNKFLQNQGPKVVNLRNISQNPKKVTEAPPPVDSQLQGSAAQAAKYQRVKKKFRNDSISSESKHIGFQDRFNDGN